MRTVDGQVGNAADQRRHGSVLRRSLRPGPSIDTGFVVTHPRLVEHDDVSVDLNRGTASFLSLVDSYVELFNIDRHLKLKSPLHVELY